MQVTVKKILFTLLMISWSVQMAGQDTWYGSANGMKNMLNPSFSGVSGNKKITVSSFNFLPGEDFGLNSVFASYDSYFPGLHGGVSAWVINDFLGKVANDLRAGIAYSYHLKAGDRLFFNAGLTASMIHLGIDRSQIIFPDDIDPYGGIISTPGEVYSGKGITRFDVNSGFSVASGEWYCGFAVMHLARPAMSESKGRESRLSRRYIIEGGTAINARDGKTIINPSIMFIKQGNWFIADGGVDIQWNQLGAGVSLWYIKDGITALRPSIGWMGGSATISLSYSYNLGLTANTLPSTAIVGVSASFIFNDVEKRKAFHVIKLPEM